MPAINDAKAFGRKLAFTVPPAAGPPQIVAPKTPKPPVIGERKALPQPPPASMDAISASKSMRPSPKTASAVTAMVPKTGVKRAPSYTKQGRKGKKVMPMPHNKQNKKASAADFGRQMAAVCFEKQALGGLGTFVGAIGGTAGAPKGKRTEGLGRGVGQGLGWDVGAGLGTGVGGAAGLLATHFLAPLIAKRYGGLQDGQLSPSITSRISGPMAQSAEYMKIQRALGGLGIAAGGAAGYLGGGLLGRSTAKAMMGKPSWEEERDTQGEQDATTANMTAP